MNGRRAIPFDKVLAGSPGGTSNPSFPLRRPEDYACDQEEDGRDLPKEFPVHAF